MLKLAEVRKTTRATGVAGLRTVHPHFLRDRSLQPRITLATRYLDSMVGHARSELDQEVMVQLFGDHKLARGIAAALASTFTFRQLSFGDMLDAAACERLHALGLATPSGLRLWLFRRANAPGHGFVRLAERASYLESAAQALGLDGAALERLMTLDAPANAILCRMDAPPPAEDVVARYNFQVVSALLANGSLVRIALSRACHAPAAVRDLCAAAGVRTELSSRELVLHGRQDVFGGWARYGARLARLVADLLATGLPARALECLVEAVERGQWLFKADADVLGYLGLARAGRGALWDVARLVATQRQLDNVLSAVAGLRRGQEHHGWLVRRAVEPLVIARGLVPVMATALRGQDRVVLVPGPVGDSEQVAGLVGHQAYLILDPSRDAAASESRGPGSVARIATRNDIAQLPYLLDSAAAQCHADAARERWSAILADVERTGVLTESRIAARLDCPEEEVARRMDEHDARQERERRGVRYVEGFGLCTHLVLTRAREAARDVAAQRGAEPVGPAWTARVLGRRLRELTGASEGIECLIAYLGAA